MKKRKAGISVFVAAVAGVIAIDGAVSASSAQECMIGEVRMFGGNFAPRSWMLAEGQLLAVSQNDALFSILGTIYGGDGRTTFALPDLRGRAAIGAGTGPGLSARNLGAKIGAQTTTVTAQNMPSHTHAATTTVGMQTGAGAANSGAPTSNTLAQDPAIDIYGAAAPDVTLSSGSASATTALAATGGSPSFDNYQASAGTNYIICIAGIYPSRS